MTLATILTAALAFTARPADVPAPVGARVAEFARPDAATAAGWSLAANTRDAKATVVVFLSTGCPVATAYAHRLTDLHKKYAAKGVVFVGINSHPLDTAADVATQAKQAGLPFPVLKDDGTTLADKFAVDRLPTVFVLDASHTVRYAGRIDDQFAPNVHRPKPTTRELADALDAVVGGRDVKTPFVAAAGCKLGREKPVVAAATPVTYHADVAGILNTRCAMCHRPGEAGPFPLLNFRQAKAWGEMIKEVVADGVMPPWHADAPPGHFRNDRRLTAAEKATLTAWVDQGCPEGDPAKAPPAPQFQDGWRLGRVPDKVYKMNKTVPVPAQGSFGMGVPYAYVEAGEPFAEDVWVSAAEVRPDYRAVVHHIIVFVIPGDQQYLQLNPNDFGRYLLAAYVPGDEPSVFPAGMAKKVTKGSRLLFEVHYTPNGRAGTDQSVVGLVFHQGPPPVELKTHATLNGRFTIPPGAANHEVKAKFAFDRPATLLAFTPHMHVRGKAFRFELVTADGTRETLLNVPKYEFDWQPSYVLAKPRQVPAGSRLECTAWYDNSTANPANPDPKKAVKWGNQTWEEMMIGFLEYHDTEK